MKKEIWIVIILAIIIVVLTVVLIFLPTKKNLKPVGTDGIQITSPAFGATVSSPLKITGTVNGNGWAGFEGQVGTVKLLDSNGKEITSTYLPATTEWTVLPTNFEAILNFKSDIAQSGMLIFRNENPSGLPEKDKTFILPVEIPKVDTIKVQVYFSNLALSASNQTDECKRVYPVDRYINKTQAVAGSAIEELLKGPSEREKAKGYTTSIPVGSKLDAIVRIVGGVAYAYFNETTESGGGSCSMAARVAQITQTLLQFPSVKSVKLSINGRTEDIFQP